MTSPVIYGFDGFDDYGTSGSLPFQSIYGGTASISSMISGAFGGNAVTGSGLAALCPIPSPVASLVGGGRFMSPNNGSSCAGGLVFADESENNILSIWIVNAQNSNSGTATIYAARGSSNRPANTNSVSGTILASATIPWILNTWYEIEAELTVSTTDGALTVKQNSQVVAALSMSLENTQGTAGSTIGYAGTWVCFNDMFMDDMYLSDAFLTAVAGPMGPRVFTAFPTSDVQKAWTPNSGTTDFSQVSEAAFDGDTTYISSNTVGVQDIYGVGALPTLSTVLAAQVSHAARMDDAGTRETSGSIVSGGTTYQGTTRTLTANYQKFVDLYQNDPATGAAWAASKFVNAQVEPGVLLVA